MGTPNPWPIHFTDVQQLDYLLYGRPCTLAAASPLLIHQRYLSTYLQHLPTQLGFKKKGDLFLVVVWKGG